MTIGPTTPKSPLIALTMAEATMMTIPKTRNVAKVLSHLSLTSSRLLPMLARTPLFSIRRTGNARENIIASIIPGTIRAMNPKMTMTPTTILSAQIQSSFETANLTDVPISACPFSICSEASLIAVPCAIGENTTVTMEIRAMSRTRAPRKLGNQLETC